MGLFASIANALSVSLVSRSAPTELDDQVRQLPAARKAAGPPRPVIGNLPLSLSISRIGGSISPSTVSSIMREADAGYMWRLMDLANEMRQKDCHLQSVLATRELAVSGLDWTVRAVKLPGDEMPTAANEDVARFVVHALEQAIGIDQDVRSFDDMLAHMNGAPFYGYATSEIEWSVVGGRQVPLGFRNQAQRRYRYRESDGRLVWWDQAGASAASPMGVDLVATYPGKFIQHQPRLNGDIAAREGLVRVLMWSALFRNWTIADWMKLAELSWKPWRLGKYKKNDYASQEDIDGLLDILEQLTTNGVAVHPDNVEVELKQPQNTGQGAGGVGNHQALAEFMAAEMSKAVLGQTLTTESGKRGARSLGEVHDRVRRDVRDNDAQAVATSITRDLVRPLVELNFGSSTPVPRFVFLTEDVADLGDLMTAVKTGTDAGARIPERWVHDRGGIPIPKDGERIIGGVASDAAPSSTPPTIDDEDDEI